MAWGKKNEALSHLLFLPLLWGVGCEVDKSPSVNDGPEFSAAEIELGRLLFYDLRLSVNEGRSCGICHEQAKAFSDGLVRAAGTTGEIHPHNTPALFNLEDRFFFGRANPIPMDLQTQMVTPLFGSHPVEMGMDEALLLERVQGEPIYERAFESAYGVAPAGITLDLLTQAILAFESGLISENSLVDKARRGEAALGGAARRGQALFESERLGCVQCHGGAHFDTPVGQSSSLGGPLSYFNIGLYNLNGVGAYPEGAQGLFEYSGLEGDRGKFRVPSLRNVAVTHPYMHDGSVLTLSDVLDIYAQGGRLLRGGPYAGDGRENPNKDPRIVGFDWSDSEKADLLAFLEALTDFEVLEDPAFSDPWESVGVLAEACCTHVVQ